MFRGLGKVTTLIVFSASAAGCGMQLPAPRPNLVDSVFEAGETNVSVLNVRRWSDARRELAVAFPMDAATALGLALPRTSAMEERLLDAFSARLGVGLPQSGTTISQETNLADGTVSGTRTDSRSPGTAPDVESPAGAAGGREIDKQPRLPEDQRNATLAADDPLLRYQSANAIYQFVQLVNGLVENTPEIEGYTPFLVTLQVSSVPYARHQPYDVHVDMSFYPRVDQPASEAAECTLAPEFVPGQQRQGPLAQLHPHDIHHLYKTPLVVPLLVTDNLEGQIASRSAELIRQIGFAATAVQSGIGASLGVSSFNARAGAVFGTDLTSTFTVGKTTENGLLAVLGAPRNPVSDYAMTRRTHNISVLLLVPNEIAEAARQWEPPARPASGSDSDPEKVSPEDFEVRRRVQVLFSVDLRRPDEVGSPLPLGQEELGNFAIRRLTERGVMPEAGILEQLVKYIPEGDYPGFVRCYHKLSPEPEFESALFHTLSEIYGRSPRFRTTTIPLPKPEQAPAPFALEQNQIAAAFDDPNSNRMTVTLTGASGRTPADLTGTLLLTAKDGIRYPFVSTEVQRDASRLTFVFPSATAWGLADVSANEGRLEIGFARRDDDASPTHFDRVVFQAAPTREEQRATTGNARARAVVTASNGGGLAIDVTEAAPATP